MQTDEEIKFGPRKSSAKKMAVNLLSKAKVKTSPINLRGVIEYLQTDYSLAVTAHNFPNKISGIIVMIGNDDDQSVMIGYNENHPWCRRRFTIAHEIGHLMFGHTCTKDDGQFENKGNETEAHAFAAELLMPTIFLKSDFKKTPNLDMLSKQYLVSKEALTLKLLDAHLLK